MLFALAALITGNCFGVALGEATVGQQDLTDRWRGR